MNAHFREVEIDDVAQVSAPAIAFAPLSRVTRAAPLNSQPLGTRALIFALVICIQVGVFGAFTYSHVTARPTPPSVLYVVDVPPETTAPPPPPRAPRLTMPQVVLPELHLPEIAPAPDAITLPPPKPAESAPAMSGPGDNGLSIVTAYQTQLLRHLARHKRYPAAARAKRAQGVAHVRFTMDRAGHVLSVALVKTTGAETLDNESVALLRRAEPLPAPPPEVRGNPVDMVVPIEFTLR